MLRQRFRTVTVEDPVTGVGILVTPDEDLPKGVSDDDVNPRAFEPWSGEEQDLGDLEYDDMTARELARLVKERGLEPASTKKTDLISVLEEDDAAHQ